MPYQHPRPPVPVVHGRLEDVPVRAVAAVGEQPGAAQPQHEGQRRQGVQPKVGDHHRGEDHHRAGAARGFA